MCKIYRKQKCEDRTGKISADRLMALALLLAKRAALV